MQGLLTDHPGQAVRAQQVPVAGPDLAQRQIGFHVGPAIQGPQQHRALRVGGDVVGADPPLVDQRLDQRVVMRDLMELAAPEQVGAGVTDVAEGHPWPGPQHRGQRRAHALDRRIGGDHVVQRVVGVGDRVGQRVEQVVAGHLVVELGDGGDRGGAGHLAGRVATHAIGHRQQARAGIRRVLVPLPEEADI